MVDIKIQKIATEMVPANIQGLVIEVTEISIQEKAIDISIMLHRSRYY